MDVNGNTARPALTLEIGGGHSPSPEADVAVDPSAAGRPIAESRLDVNVVYAQVPAVYRALLN